MSVVKIHFPGLRPDREPIDLARALGVAGTPMAGNRIGWQYEQLNQEAPKCFSIVGMDEADVAVYPYRAEGSDDERRAAEEARERGIGCVFLSWGDRDVAISLPYGTVYRHSLFSDRRLACERAWPAFCADPLKDRGGVVKARPKSERPSVGFCGFVSTPLWRTIYRMMGRSEKARGLALRARALRALSRSGIDTRFICRAAYWAGTIGHRPHDAENQRKTWDEFVTNLVETDYNLALRGAGNFSYRLYEILAAGRIPVFVNTRCVLPFENEIDWRRHCVWVEEDQLDQAGEILKDFHRRITEQEFIALQKANRELWERYLCPLGFYAHALKTARPDARSPGPA